LALGKSFNAESKTEESSISQATGLTSIRRIIERKITYLFLHLQINPVFLRIIKPVHLNVNFKTHPTVPFPPRAVHKTMKDRVLPTCPVSHALPKFRCAVLSVSSFVPEGSANWRMGSKILVSVAACRRYASCKSGAGAQSVPLERRAVLTRLCYPQNVPTGQRNATPKSQSLNWGKA
jgi:hypothetical protein